MGNSQTGPRNASVGHEPKVNFRPMSDEKKSRSEDFHKEKKIEAEHKRIKNKVESTQFSKDKFTDKDNLVEIC